jgi:hypothetical protein
LIGYHTEEFFKRHHSNQSDLDFLKNMRLTMQKDDVFEFDFTKRTKADVPVLIDSLEQEIEADSQKAIKLEQQVFQYFYRKAQEQGRGQEIQQAYRNVYHKQENIKPCQHLVECLQGHHQLLATRTKWTDQQVIEFNGVLKDLEQGFKNFIANISANSALEEISNKEEFEKWKDGKANYMQSTMFSHEGLEKLTGRIYEVLSLLHRQWFISVKELAQLQLTFLPEKVVA